MAIVSDQVQYESRTRSRWAIVAFVAAVGLVLSQLLELSGPQPPVSEATVTLITENARATVDLTVAAINRMNIQGTTEQQAEQLRATMAVVFPEAVTLVREAREGLA